jgi:hypothetical protein
VLAEYSIENKHITESDKMEVKADIYKSIPASSEKLLKESNTQGTLTSMTDTESAKNPGFISFLLPFIPNCMTTPEHSIQGNTSTNHFTFCLPETSCCFFPSHGIILKIMTAVFDKMSELFQQTTQIKPKSQCDTSGTNVLFTLCHKLLHSL